MNKFCTIITLSFRQCFKMAPHPRKTLIFYKFYPKCLLSQIAQRNFYEFCKFQEVLIQVPKKIGKQFEKRVQNVMKICKHLNHDFNIYCALTYRGLGRLCSGWHASHLRLRLLDGRSGNSFTNKITSVNDIKIVQLTYFVDSISKYLFSTREKKSK